LICCFITVKSFGQFFLGVTGGIGAYQWDKVPVDNSMKTSGGIFSEILGFNLGVGNETFRFILEGYEDYAPFTFSMDEFQGMGTLSVGAMVKLSLTPFGDSWDAKKGFSLGLGIETTKTELHFRNRDVIRNWNPTKFGYIAYSLFDDDEIPVQMDVFCKAAIGNHPAMRMEIGLRASWFLFLGGY
jgi:hypothetical protein